MNLYNPYNKFDRSGKDSSSSAKLTPEFPKEIIILFATLFVSCAVMLYLVAPLHKEVKIIKAVNEIKKGNIESGRMSLARIIKISNENEEFKNSEIEKIKSFIPNRDNYEDYLAHFIKLANNKNIKIGGFSISENKSGQKRKDEDKAFNEIKIDIKASGNFLNFMSFIQDIEKGIPFIHEESISILGIEESGAAGENEETKTSVNPALDYEICLKFYHY